MYCGKATKGYRCPVDDKDCHSDDGYCGKLDKSPQADPAKGSNAPSVLVRLDGCIKEVSAIMAEAQAARNRMAVLNLGEAETYLDVAKGYLSD